METVQYHAELAITRAIRGFSGENLYQGLVLESLYQRRWYRKVCYLFELTKNKSPKYLFTDIPTVRSAYRTIKVGSILSFSVRYAFVLQI